MIQKISSANFISFQKKLPKTPVHAPRINFEGKNDSVELSTKTQKVSEEISKVENKAINESKEVKKAAAKEYAEVKQLIEAFELADKGTIRTKDIVIDYDLKQGFMKEFHKGELVRHTIFAGYGRDIGYILKGESEDSIEKTYLYENGEIKNYTSNERYDGDTTNIGKRFEFENGKLKIYEEGINETPTTTKIKKIATIENGKVKEYVRNYKEDEEGHQSGAKYIRLSSGDIIRR